MGDYQQLWEQINMIILKNNYNEFKKIIKKLKLDEGWYNDNYWYSYRPILINNIIDTLDLYNKEGLLKYMIFNIKKYKISYATLYYVAKNGYINITKYILKHNKNLLYQRDNNNKTVLDKLYNYITTTKIDDIRYNKILVCINLLKQY